MREFARVTKPGGLIVSCNFDGFGITHEPPDPAMQPLAEHVFKQLARLIRQRVPERLASVV